MLLPALGLLAVTGHKLVKAFARANLCLRLELSELCHRLCRRHLDAMR